MTRLPRRPSANTAAGFSMIELTVVAAIMAVMLMVVFPRLDHLSPKYSLRASAREVASTIEWAQGEAISKGKTFHLRYRLRDGRYALVIPAGWFDEGGQEEVLNWRQLPEGVRFDAIILPNNEPAQQDEVDLKFHPLGISGSHIVRLVIDDPDKGQRLMAIKFNALIGTVRYFEGEEEVAQARFRELEE